MEKTLKAWWCPICLLILLMAGCQGQDQVSSKTLLLTISSQDGNWTVTSHLLTDHPYYSSSANAPIYQADLRDASGKVIRSVFFGKEYINTGGEEFKLPFPSLKQAKKIVIYRLNSSSGHITNKNRDKVLTWEVPQE
ncbi:MAG TPA: hypothetical protein VKA08_05330 [Balneolales bacterium]|nr:hypothetical protein [Balneolales bacterium]